jgi:hypothetical protein
MVMTEWIKTSFIHSAMTVQLVVLLAPADVNHFFGIANLESSMA